MGARHYIKNNIKLHDDRGNLVFFSNVKKTKENTNTISYEAKCKGKWGILREFYPIGFSGLVRNSGGQLIPRLEDNELEHFRQMENDFRKPYEDLISEKAEHKESSLNYFIPSMEVFTGSDDDEKPGGTSYIWIALTNHQSFESICKEIHKHPKANPEKKLITVLTAIRSLTECVAELHKLGMIHRHITPEAFGFAEFRDKTRTDSIRFLEMDSISYKNRMPIENDEKPGFTEPEVGEAYADERTDLFSIGAVLFYSIIDTEDVIKRGHIYDESDFANLHNLVSDSALIKASESNSHPRLRKNLSDILQKCLCNREERFCSCEELVDALNKALFYALPSEFAKKNEAGEYWELKDLEKALDKRKDKDSLLSIQYHLYEHPLYSCVGENEVSINVLVLGFKDYGQLFLDACLQAGQIRNMNLMVTVVSDDCIDRQIYLEDRPDLNKFFTVDGKLDYHNKEDSYGNIIFKTRPLERNDYLANNIAIQDIILEQSEEDRPEYIFVALGDDELNKSAACTCYSAINELGLNCITCFVNENGKPGKELDSVYPVFVNAKAHDHPLYNEIERMALNTHLIWEPNLNLDFRRVKKQFNERYNHDSSVSSVLSLKYKLHSVGIDLDTTSFSEAARQFLEVEKDKMLKNELIWIEHRRWVAEKLCQGWRRIDNLSVCSGGVTKDKKGKKHICIVHSNPEQRLRKTYWTKNNYKAWKTPSENDVNTDNEFKKLDELDRMSVKLHRIYERKAKSIKKQDLLSENNWYIVKSLLGDNSRAIGAFREWYECLKGIWNGDKSKVSLYKGLKNTFLSEIDDFPDNNKKAIISHIDAFETLFVPVMESLRYRDWKQVDVAMIENIPFVLTYTENVYMAIPFKSGGDSTSVFSNVAAPTIVNPSMIIYAILIESVETSDYLISDIQYALDYIRRKNLKSQIAIVLAYTKKVSDKHINEIEQEIKKIGKGRVRYIKRIHMDNASNCADETGKYLEKLAKGKRFFALEKNDSRIGAMLEGAGYCDSLRSYAFDSKNMKFIDSNNCEMFSYIHKKHFITVEDITAFPMYSSENSDQPEFVSDYKELWNTYCDDRASWKNMCAALSKISSNLLERFNINQKKKEQFEYTYMIPLAGRNGAEKILTILKARNIIENDSCIEGYNANSCIVKVVDKRGNAKKFENIFSKIHMLLTPDYIGGFVSGDTFDLTYDELNALGTLAINGKDNDSLWKMLRFFAKKRYILNLKVNGNLYQWWNDRLERSIEEVFSGNNQNVSFVYASRQIKDLLTNEGKLLEVYTYHKAKESGVFDDVICSMEINWENETNNELDCILTSGFRSFFIECKGRKELDKDFYYKLRCITEDLGINATAILVADTQETISKSSNRKPRQYGEHNNVITVWKEDEINNIGKTLAKIAADKYSSEV